MVRVGITHGDINGVGYEIILKVLGEEGMTDLFIPVVFGVKEILQEAQEKFGLQNLRVNYIKEASEAKPGRVNLVMLEGDKSILKPGTVTKEAGKTAVEALEKAVEALKNQDIDVLVTAPINKEAVQSEAFAFPGHTEYLSERIGEGREAMMILCSDTLRVALLTKHIPVSKIAENITKEKVMEAVTKFSKVLKQDFGIVRPTIAVLSLNPHAGDGGLLGNEEEEILIPAIDEVQQQGVLAFGPFPADGFFGHGSYKKFDGILAMYHDQGLAPFKTIATSGGVNFSANLPYVRTSPDHGTAFDIAWQGEADPTSLKEAIYMAIDIFKRRSIYEESASNPLKKHVHERPERMDKTERGQNKNDFNAEMDD